MTHKTWAPRGVLRTRQPVQLRMPSLGGTMGRVKGVRRWQPCPVYRNVCCQDEIVRHAKYYLIETTQEARFDWYIRPPELFSAMRTEWGKTYACLEQSMASTRQV